MLIDQFQHNESKNWYFCIIYSHIYNQFRTQFKAFE